MCDRGPTTARINRRTIRGVQVSDCNAIIFEAQNAATGTTYAGSAYRDITTRGTKHFRRARASERDSGRQEFHDPGTRIIEFKQRGCGIKCERRIPADRAGASPKRNLICYAASSDRATAAASDRQIANESIRGPLAQDQMRHPRRLHFIVNEEMQQIRVEGCDRVGVKLIALIVDRERRGTNDNRAIAGPCRRLR